MMNYGIGISVHVLQIILFPDIKNKGLYYPCKFPLGPIAVVALVQGVMEFIETGSS